MPNGKIGSDTKKREMCDTPQEIEHVVLILE